jgi:hypothetical protein
VRVMSVNREDCNFECSIAELGVFRNHAWIVTGEAAAVLNESALTGTFLLKEVATGEDD